MGARNANVDQQLARFELDNHRANIIPVAQFFDQQGYLHLVHLKSQKLFS